MDITVQGEQLPQASALLYYYSSTGDGKQTQQVTAVLNSVNIEV